MKKLLFVVLEQTQDTHNLLHELSLKGINGTAVASSSLKHILADENEDIPQFISLSHIHENKFTQNTTIYFVLEEKEVNEVKEIIRNYTNNFTSTKGGMFSLPLNDFEGSF